MWNIECLFHNSTAVYINNYARHDKDLTSELKNADLHRKSCKIKNLQPYKKSLSINLFLECTLRLRNRTLVVIRDDVFVATGVRF